MGKKKFVCDPNGIYHVTARCINREWFCSIDLAWKFFCEQLWFISNSYDVEIHSFVLMPNHFHLIIKAPKGNLSAAMRWLLSETSRSITRASHRINETYGTRFHRSLISNNHYYFQCMKYVYHNPVKAGLALNAELYKFSSLNGLIGLSRLEFPVHDRTVIDATSFEGTLQWINRKPHDKDWTSIQKAVRRTKFSLSKENSRPSRLEDRLL